MIFKNTIRILIIGLVFVTQTTTLARANRRQHTHKNQVQWTVLNQPESNAQNEIKQKKSSMNRQRMSAGKIVGTIALVVLSIVAFGALLWFGIGLYLLSCGL